MTVPRNQQCEEVLSQFGVEQLDWAAQIPDLNLKHLQDVLADCERGLSSVWRWVQCSAVHNTATAFKPDA